jgi:adenylate cyclase
LVQCARLAALEEIMQVAASWTKEQRERGIILDVNGAMAAGPVVFAALGNASRLEYTVIGEAVNLAAKLEKHNKVERSRALCPVQSYQLACDQGHVPQASYEHREARQVAGVDAPLGLVVLDRLNDFA